MDRRIQAPLVDSSSCLCRAERAVAVTGNGRHAPKSRSCVQSSVRASIHPLNEKRSSRGDRRSSVRRGQLPLLPGLPDDLAIACLIRVPRAEHWKLGLVCRRWLRLLAGNYFYGLRRRHGLTEQWLYAFKCDGYGLMGACRGTCSTQRRAVGRGARCHNCLASTRTPPVSAAPCSAAATCTCSAAGIRAEEPCAEWCSTAPGVTGGTAPRTCCAGGTASAPA
ncbi:unnamed protein product [Alopecurus aequalis]